LILYEYPFNERIRTLLRLEDLFERFTFFLTQEDAREHHVALTTLFEIAEVAGRTDLKADLMKELERQRQTLAPFRGNPGIEQEALEAVLGEIEQTLGGLTDMHGKTGQHLADNEWLASIRSRTIIPGGTCKFDLPSYYAWQQRPAEARFNDIITWFTPLAPLFDALALVLRLLRDSGGPVKMIAAAGSYQQMLQGKVYQMLRLTLDASQGAIPEISANKYMLWVRFTSQGGDLKPKPLEDDVPFELTLCNF